VRGYLEYNTDLFAPPSIERMADHYGILLSSILANPEGRIGTHPMLSQKEREQLLVEWNATTAKIPRQVCFPQIFEQQVASTPDQLAVVDGSRQLTYRQLNRQANGLASLLRKQGVGPEAVVALLMNRSLEFLTSML